MKRAIVSLMYWSNVGDRKNVQNADLGAGLDAGDDGLGRIRREGGRGWRPRPRRGRRGGCGGRRRRARGGRRRPRSARRRRWRCRRPRPAHSSAVRAMYPMRSHARVAPFDLTWWLLSGGGPSRSTYVAHLLPSLTGSGLGHGRCRRWPPRPMRRHRRRAAAARRSPASSCSLASADAARIRSSSRWIGSTKVSPAWLTPPPSTTRSTS